MTTRSSIEQSGAMENIAPVGTDLAKRVFHVAPVDAAGAVIERRRLRRAGASVVPGDVAEGLRGRHGGVRRRRPLVRDTLSSTQ